MKTIRLSDHDIDRLLARACAHIKIGWAVVRPIYVDWLWRGYSIVLEWDPQRGAVE